MPGVLTPSPCPRAEWSQRDLARAETIKSCRQYLVFHDATSIVYAGPAGTCCEIKDECVPPVPRVPAKPGLWG